MDFTYYNLDLSLQYHYELYYLTRIGLSLMLYCTFQAPPLGAESVDYKLEGYELMTSKRIQNCTMTRYIVFILRVDVLSIRLYGAKRDFD